MPSSARRERARRLGLCVECTNLPAREGQSRCVRCAETHRLRDRRLAASRNLKRRLGRAHLRALRAWALAPAGSPIPEPPTWVPPSLWWVARKRRWHRRTPKKPYRYTPRALPKTT